MRFPDKERHQIFLEPEGLGRRRDLRQRPVDEPAARRAGRDRARAARPRGRGDSAARVRRRVRLHSTDRARSLARDQARARPVSRRPDQRHVGLRGSGGAGTCGRPERRAPRDGAWRPSCSGATRPTSAFSSTISSRADVSSRTACSRRAPSIGCCCASTTPTCGSRRSAAPPGWSMTRAGIDSSGGASGSSAIATRVADEDPDRRTHHHSHPRAVASDDDARGSRASGLRAGDVSGRCARRRRDVPRRVQVPGIFEATRPATLSHSRPGIARDSVRVRVPRHSRTLARGRRAAHGGPAGNDRSGLARPGRHAGGGGDRRGQGGTGVKGGPEGRSRSWA